MGLKKRKPPTITTEQRGCIEYPSNANLLIRGIPGSGKTTVLVERARYLKSKGETGILLLTYNSMLAQFIRELSLKMPGDPVEANTFHGWGRRLLKAAGKWPANEFVNAWEREDLIKQAITAVGRRAGLEPPAMPGVGKDADPYRLAREQAEFLEEEFSWIKGLGKDRPHYMEEPRTGRGSAVVVQRKHREWIWATYDEYMTRLARKQAIDFDDLAPLLVQNLRWIPVQELPYHVLIDEAQDLTAMQLKAIKELTRKSLTIAADKGQSIYKRNFSWAALGIDIRGRSRSLVETFRSTRQIIQLARSLQRHDPLVLRKDEEWVPGVDPDVDGLTPELYVSPTLRDMVPMVLNWVHERVRDFPEDTTAIIVPTTTWREKFEEELTHRRLPYVVLKSDQNPDIMAPGIKLVSYHSAKGLEFDHVAVTCLRDGTLPGKPERGISPEDLEEYLATERRKVYVAITRARVTVALFGASPPSQFIGEMDYRLYKRER